MKNLIFLFFLIFWSCNQTKDNKELNENTITNTSEKTNNNSKIENVNTLKLGDYYNYISQLDSYDANSSLKSVDKFKELFTEQKDTLCDEAFIIFNELYEKIEKNLNEIHQKDTIDYEPLLYVYEKGKEPVISQKLIDYNNNLKNNGFQISSEEGMTYIKQDRDFISNHFYQYVSNPMKQYLIQLNKENKEGFWSDGGLIVSPKTLAERVIWYENFMLANPHFVFNNKCLENKKEYFSVLFTGLDNSPLYEDNEKKKISKEYVDSYQYLISMHPNSQTTKLIKPYFLALNQGQKIRVEEILKQYRQEKLIN
jgi:hypothetical protein